jgi:hypothetical protein
MAHLKHLGYNANSKRKYVVVFRELPNDTANALVVDTGTLLDRYHDGLMSAIESLEAQANNDCYDVLNRKYFFDGESILQTLHRKNWLIKVPVEEIVLTPAPNKEISLVEHNESLKNVAESLAPAPDVAELQRPSAPQGEMTEEEERKGQARNLIIQAQLMEEDARKKRAQAESISPGINDETKRPRGRPKAGAPASPLLKEKSNA